MRALYGILQGTRGGIRRSGGEFSFPKNRYRGPGQANPPANTIALPAAFPNGWRGGRIIQASFVPQDRAAAIGELLGEPEGTVRTRLMHAKRKLRASLDDYRGAP